MGSELQPDTKENNEPDKQRETPSRSPFVRLGLCVIFVLTLPFTWGETSSCNGPVKAYTGLEQATKSPSNTISLIVIFATPVLLAFVQYYLRPTWMRALAELIAGMFASFGAFYCFVSTIFSGDLSHKSGRFFPAPLIATIAMFLMTLHAFRGAIGWIAEMVRNRRKGRAGE